MANIKTLFVIYGKSGHFARCYRLKNEVEKENIKQFKLEMLSKCYMTVLL